MVSRLYEGKFWWEKTEAKEDKHKIDIEYNRMYFFLLNNVTLFSKYIILSY